MRYSVVAKSISVSEAEKLCRNIGAQNISTMPQSRIVFCDMSDEQAQLLSQNTSLVVRAVEKHQAAIMVPTIPKTAQSTYVGSYDLSPVFREIQMTTTPPLDGYGATIAVFDTGIRKTHNSLKDKVVYEYNTSSSNTTSDIFGHGTQVAYLIAGEDGERCGIAPGASVMNIKVMDDNGEGTDETIIMGIEHVISLALAAKNSAKSQLDPMYPNIINMSIGKPDNGDKYDPVRIACRQAVTSGISVIASAGNSGPLMSTILCPAVDKSVLAVGGTYTDQFKVWEYSSRGPTLEGEIKPDIVCWSVGIEVAGHQSDTIYVNKSGTSFAAPIISGLDAIVWDLVRRFTGVEFKINLKDIIEYMPTICTKPPDAEVAVGGKDNSYGYGFPVIGSIAGRLSQRPSDVFTSIIPLFILFSITLSLSGGEYVYTT